MKMNTSQHNVTDTQQHNITDMQSQKMKSVQLCVEPQTSLIDEKVEIIIKRLLPKQAVTLTAELVERKKIFVSYAYYMADEYGQVDVSQMKSLGGTYTGVEPMGLFWSMQQAPGQRKGLKLAIEDPTLPFDIDISVYNDHVNPFAKTGSGNCFILDEKNVQRTYMKKGVKRLSVRCGRIRGFLYIPPGEGPFPGVIDLFGGGLLKQQQNALLSSYGFVTLCLAYSNFEDLSYTCRLGIEIEYIEEAIDWIRTRSYVIQENIGIIGTSFGAELAMLTASLVHKFKAVVAIGNNPYLFMFPHTYKGTEYPSIPLYEQSITKNEEGDFITGGTYPPRLPAEARIKLENLRCPLLIIQGTDDKFYYPCAAEDVANMERQFGKLDVEVLTYEGAGHMIEIPYTPLCSVNYHGILRTYVLQGGQTVAHARAQEDSWPRILQFLYKNLHKKQMSKL